ncbi:MAG: 3-phosphoshikimate 1-carboxyvinyltransferase [Elusimicrobia bacterium]|nr:3-phosphoshikimate 1-carboxyvinyltransferase [Elusimicrobiota bacterium]
MSEKKIIYYPPADKSITVRALVIASLCSEKIIIKNPLISDDTVNSVKALIRLGVNIKNGSDFIEVTGKCKYGFHQRDIDCGESALFLRLILPVLLNQKKTYRITGKKTLLRRSFKDTLSAFESMGAHIKHNNYHLPITVYPSELKPVKYRTSSAQTKSSLLIASLYTKEIKIIEDVKTREHTERILEYLGCEIKKNGNKLYIAKNQLMAKNLEICGDISQAAVFITISLFIGREILVKNCGINPLRTGFLKAISDMGVVVKINNKRYISNELVGDILIKPPKILKAIKIYNITPLIDEVFLIALLMASADGVSEIKNTEMIRNKESDRENEIINLLHMLGVSFKKKKNSIVIYGTKSFKKISCIDTKGDHRLAMVAGVLKIINNPKIKVKNKSCVSKTYPDFWDDLIKFGFF